jgi:hypothetical protein
MRHASLPPEGARRKRADLERWGALARSRTRCRPRRRRHDAWQHTETRAKSFVPRHREIGVGVARAICRQLGVPPIPKR